MLSNARALFVVLVLTIVCTWNAKPARAACNPAIPVDGDTVVCDGTDSTGYDGSGATRLTVTTLGAAELDDSNLALDSAILVADDNTVTIGADAMVTVMDDDGFGVRGGDGNEITNQGTITIDADNAVGLGGNNDNFITNDTGGTIVINGLNGRGISLNQNTTGILPNGGVNRGTITINATALGSFAIESGDNAGVATTGTITLSADNSRGISAGNRSNPSLPSNLSNSGLIDVDGDNSFGIKAGDGWIQGALVGGSGFSQGAIFTVGGSTINVRGADSYGIYAGDDLNLAGNNNSFVLNIGTIDVTGVDATGVSLGGQDLLDPFDVENTAQLSITSFANFGTIVGGPDAKPLIEFRSFVAGRENSIGNATGGRILADTTHLGTSDRGIAIRGTAGDEFIVNLGEIVGELELNGGSDTYFHGSVASLTNSLLAGDGDDLVANEGTIAGTIDLGDGNDTYRHAATATLGNTVIGGAGIDRAVLGDNSTAAQTFDVSQLSGFETLVIGGGTFGWELTNTAGFSALTTEIANGGRLRVPTPITLDGDFIASPTGTLDLAIDGATPALTVGGASTFAGNLIVRANPGVAPGPTRYLTIDAMGGSSGQFQLVPISGNQLFEAFYDAAGLSVQLVSRNSLGVARGSSERAIAKHLDDIAALGTSDPVLQNLLDEFDTSTGNLNTAFRALSPEVYDAQTSVLVDGGQRVSNLLFDRPRECKPDQPVPWQAIDGPLPCHARNGSLWLAGIGGRRSRRSFNGHLRYDADIGGLVLGADIRPVEHLDLTLAIASQRGTIDGASRGKSTITLTDLVGHAAWNQGALRIQGTVGWGHGFHQDRRRVRFSEPGLTPIDLRGTEDRDSDRVSIAAEVGYLFDVGPVKVEPIGGLDWAWVNQRPIRESEAFGLGVRIEGRDDSIGSINAGVRVSTSYVHSKYLGQNFLWMDGVWKPTIEVRWRQMVAGYERDVEARLLGAPAGVANFTVKGKEDPAGAEIAAGFSFTPKNANRLQFDLRYESFVAAHTVTHNLTAKALIGF